MEHETFFTLLRDKAHWEFELLLIFIFDVIVGVVLLPRLRKWATHHESDDEKIEKLEAQVKEIREKIGIKEDKS